MKNIQNNQIRTQVEATISSLREAHEQWTTKQCMAHDALYALLGECLSFLRFLRADEANELVFKEHCAFGWTKKTSLSTLVVKQIFGDEKKTYAYAKVLQAALIENVDMPNQPSMRVWLKQGGGINGVIRPNSAPGKQRAEYLHKQQIGRNSESFGWKSKCGPLTVPQLQPIHKRGHEHVVVFLERLSEENTFELLDYSLDENDIDRAFEKLGARIMKSKGYEQRLADFAISGVAAPNNAEVYERVKEQLSKIGTLRLEDDAAAQKLNEAA